MFNGVAVMPVWGAGSTQSAPGFVLGFTVHGTVGVLGEVGPECGHCLCVLCCVFLLTCAC